MAWHEPFEAPQTAPAQPPVLAVDTVVLLADGLTFPWRVGTWDVIEDDTGRSAIVLLRPLHSQRSTK